MVFDIFTSKLNLFHTLFSYGQAIERFAKARPPGIYKQDYIDALYAFYHETRSDLVVCPDTPEWKRSSDFDLNGEALPEDDDGVPYASTNVCFLLVWEIISAAHYY